MSTTTSAFGVQFETVGLRYVLERLTARYGSRYSSDAIDRVVREAEARYLDASVHAFVPLLVERDARRVLDLPETKAVP